MEEKQLAVLLRYICDHPGCVGYDLAEAFDGETAARVVQGEKLCDLIDVGMEYEDEMACEVSLTEYGATVLAKAERAAGHPMRRKERQLDEQRALEILDSCPWAVLATADASGIPYCVALNVVREGEMLYFHCATEGHKVENLRANPQVCLTAVGNTRINEAVFTTEYESVVVHGTASEVKDREEKLETLRLLCRRFVSGAMDRFEQEAAGALEHTGVWKIRIDHLTGKSSVRRGKQGE